MKFELTSTAVTDGLMADAYGDRCDKANIVNDIPQISFPLEWKGAPEGTKSFAVGVMDYDNCESEGFPFVHWLVANIPADCSCLPEDCSRKGGDFIQGTNSWSTKFGPYADVPEELTLRFGGPAPGDVQHEYETVIYALDKVLDLKEGFYFSQLRKAMRGHILAEAVMYAQY